MKNYNTRQRRLIADFLRRNCDRPRTTDEIRRGLLSEGLSVGEATIYRTLALLVGDGVVEKLSFSGRESAAYRYVGDLSALGDSLILKCLSCGAVTRMDCDFAGMLGRHLERDHRFRLDRMKTIVYGTCGSCLAENGGKRP